MSTVLWAHDVMEIALEWDDDHPVTIASVDVPGAYRPLPPQADTFGRRSSLDQPLEPQPLVEIFLPGAGHLRSATRTVHSAVGAALRYQRHRVTEGESWTSLEIVQTSDEWGIEVVALLRAPRGAAAFTVVIEVHAQRRIVLEAVAVALSLGAPEPGPVDDLDLLVGRTDWLAEGRWQWTPLRELLPDLDLLVHPTDPKGCFAQSSRSTWSTGDSSPVGVVSNRRSNVAWGWQVETNGAWRWEVGARRDGAYVAMSGPTELDHQWSQALEQGDSFATVPVTIARSGAGSDGAIAELTRYRRAARRAHPDNLALPVVFNDYMNTLMGDPTTQKLLPLIDAAHDAGAEIFMIDAGWYDDGGDWWDSVGEWQPSTTRFPGGLGEVIDRIRERGMVPGLWLEPEVVGVRSPLARTLPDAAFLQRSGFRVREHERFHLDLRHPAARDHLDGVVDRLVADFGIGYLKLDYNITAGAGTDLAADSIGAGLLEHNRAHLEWLDGVLDRHPQLVIENCASGAMRQDFAMMSRCQLQSTSDQQSAALYPPIAVAAAMSVLPEQAANWAYPQPGMTPEHAAFTLCTAVLGRFYLSGYLNQMSESESALVSHAVDAHKLVRLEIGVAMPVWPLGLPRWTDPWVALGLEGEQSTLVTVWCRPGAPATVDLSLPSYRDRDVRVDTLFPTALTPWTFEWSPATALLRLTAPSDHSARVIRIEPVA